jgi:RNA polymerase sigma-70 factor (ECF subfamily)
VIDFYRKRNVENYFGKSGESEEENEKLQEKNITDPRKNPLEEIQLNSDIEEVKKALQNLKDEYREVIVLKYVEEMSIGEIANILGKTNGAVRVLAHRAIQMLKEAVQEK